MDKGVELVGEGLLSTGPTPSSLHEQGRFCQTKKTSKSSLY